ncbi:MAG: putative membrane protein [Cognaticolwellia sp.]|jgi:uncharacterized membrane protein|tara:strand:+ start:545 stop:871 length:327 start_codon:yes stop_codon:yes gene_type:complete
MKNILFVLIAFGFILFIGSCSSDNDLEALTYTTDIKSLIETRCISCHGNTSPNAGLSLTTYNQVRLFAETDTLVGRINDINNPMPTTGLLAQSERDMIQNWIDGGFKE